MATSRRGSGRRAAGSAAAGNTTADGHLTAGQAAHPAPLDDVARQIIEQLQADGRRSYATIGRTVGLSEAAVRQRVQRLLDSGIIQIVAVTDPLRLGFPRQAMVGIRASADLEDTAERLADLAEVDRVVITAGSFDLLTEVTCRNDEHLLDILQRLRAVDGVVATEAFVYLRSTRR